jgi:activator of 2-hydroxyglutaryl-CoA dehydratase
MYKKTVEDEGTPRVVNRRITEKGMNDLLHGIDIGTTSTKVIWISPEGKILAEESAESELASPH